MTLSQHLVLATDEARDLQSVLRALAGELDNAATMALGLQESIGAVIAELPRPVAAVYELQAADRLAQTLGDLARFVGAIAQGVPESWHVEAARAALALHQRDLARRLLEKDAVEHAEGWEEDDFLLGNG